MALALKSWIRERITAVPTASDPLADCPELCGLLTIWRHAWIGAGGRVPDRRLMDPADLPRPILPSMFIYEREGERFRCRLAGSRLREVFGHAMEGRYLDEMVKAEAAPRRNAIFKTVLDEGKPLIYSGFLVAEGKEWRYFRRLLLPMRKQADGPTDQVMGAVNFGEPPLGIRLNPRDPDGQINLIILEP
jgi:hypothetical protein